MRCNNKSRVGISPSRADVIEVKDLYYRQCCLCGMPVIKQVTMSGYILHSSLKCDVIACEECATLRKEFVLYNLVL